MLEKLLKIIRQEGGTFSLTALAARLNTSPFMVRAMLQDLANRGYVKDYTTDCNLDACGGCALKGGCKTGESPKPLVWTLSFSDKGNDRGLAQMDTVHEA